MEIRATAGESHLGGEDFTDRLVSAVLANQKIQLEVAELKHPALVSRLRSECETAKRSLSGQEKVKIRMPETDGKFAEKPKEFRCRAELLENSVAS